MAIGSIVGRSSKDILVHIRGDDKDFQKAIKNSDASMGTFASKMQQYGPMIGAAFVAAGVAAAAYSVKTALVHEQLSRGFENLAASQGKNADEYLKKIKEVSHGTVSEVEIMQKANQAMLLGIDLDTITRMMEGAAVIAQSTGQDVGYMFESLALGVGRQSRMLLDNLGIIVKVEEANQSYAESLGKTVSELTDAEKKTAFLNATMEGLNERTEALGGFTEDTTTKITKLKTVLSDASVAFGSELTPAVDGTADAFINLTGSGKEWGTTLGRIVSLPYAVPAGLMDHYNMMKDINKLREDGIDTESEFIDHLELHSSLLTEMNDKEFEHATRILTAAGYYEKTLMLERSREYGLRNILQLEQDITKEGENQTKEIEKQLSMRQRATSLREQIRAGTSFTGLSGTAGAFAAGEAYTRTSGAFTVTRAAQESGL